jgi:hypothetical protein
LKCHQHMECEFWVRETDSSTCHLKRGWGTAQSFSDTPTLRAGSIFGSSIRIPNVGNGKVECPAIVNRSNWFDHKSSLNTFPDTWCVRVLPATYSYLMREFQPRE